MRTLPCLALATCAAAGATVAEDRAVVVGIDDYTALGDDVALRGAVADARRFRDLLVGHWGFEPGQVTVLLDAEATSEAIGSAIIDGLIGGTGPGERAVLYFAGMGMRAESEAGPVAAILAHDAASLLGRVPEDLAADLLDLIPDRAVTVVIDASFDGLPEGTGLRGLPSEGPGAPEEPYGAGAAERAVWNAAGPDGLAWEAGGAGLFTGAFVAALTVGAADADGDGATTNGEMLGFLGAWARGWCAATPPCAAAGRAVGPTFAGPEAGVLPAAPLPEAERVAMEALSWSNAGGLSLSLEGEAPRVGEELGLRIQAERAGMLLLLDVSPRGEVVLAGPGFPVGGPGDGGRALRFRATEPAGRGLLIGLLVEGDAAALERRLPVEPDPAAAERLAEVARWLLRRQAGAEPGGWIAWSAAVLAYEVRP